MPYRTQTKAIQAACNQIGHDCGPEDGLFGRKTEAGVSAWLAAKGEPKANPQPRPGLLKCIVWHWSAGTYGWSGLAAEHYHFGIDGEGKVHEGDHTPEDNINVSDGDYAAHVASFNTGAIGLSLMGMGDATVGASGVINWGTWPITAKQVDAMVRLTAELCRRYAIPVTRETVLSHAEVWETHRIWQKGKWDIRCLPGWTQIKTGVETGDILRARVEALL